MGAVLAQDADLRELARAPLILNILALAYQGQRPEELVGLAEAEQRRRLFDAYVQRMFERSARNDPKRYTREQMLRWLRWLARSLANDNQTVFQVELMQPWWLKRWWEHGLYVIGSTLGASVTGSIVGSLIGVFLGLMYGLGIEGMIAAFPAEVATTNVSAVVAPGRGPIVGLSVGADFGLVSGLVGGLVAGSYQRNVKKRRTWQSINGILIVACVLFLSIVQLNRNYTITTPTLWLGLIGGLATRVLIRDEGIRPTEALRWSWRTLLRHWYFVLLFGLVGWLIFGLVGGTLFGLVGGIVQAEVQTKRTPNQGIWRSLWHSLAVCTVIGLGGALGGWLVTWLIIGLTSKLEVSLISGLLGGLLSGLVFGLVFGGLAFVQHFALRAICALCGYAPWNYPRFLDYAVERILLHRVGGSYIFVHRMLLEYFAEQDGARPS